MKRLVKENSPRDKDKNKRGERKTINKQTEPSRVELSRVAPHRTVPQQDETSRAEWSHKTNWSSHDPLAMECKIYPKGRTVPPGSGGLKSIQARAQWKIYAWRDGFPLSLRGPKKKWEKAEIRKILNHLNEMHAKDKERERERERESGGAKTRADVLWYVYR